MMTDTPNVIAGRVSLVRCNDYTFPAREAWVSRHQGCSRCDVLARHT